ncbi:MAG: sugar phosphate isomerase/epimerase [Bryobacteraceae bacterium]
MTRRIFASVLGAGIGASVRLRAGAKLNIGIGTYSYHNLSMEAMIAQLKALHVREVEMSRGDFMLLSHPGEDRFRAARGMFDAAGIRCVSYYSATIHDEHELDLAVRFASLLGARNITGDATGRALLQRIDAQCTHAGLTFGIHNHFFNEKFPYESPADVLKALSGLSKTVGATADVGQFASCGYDPVDAVRQLGPHLKLVHLKDIAAAHAEENVLLGRGIARIPEVMRELRKQQFAGLVAVEYEKEGPVEDDMRTEVEYARKLA